MPDTPESVELVWDADHGVYFETGGRHFEAERRHSRTVEEVDSYEGAPWLVVWDGPLARMNELKAMKIVAEDSHRIRVVPLSARALENGEFEVVATVTWVGPNDGYAGGRYVYRVAADGLSSTGRFVS